MSNTRRKDRTRDQTPLFFHLELESNMFSLLHPQKNVLFGGDLFIDNFRISFSDISKSGERFRGDFTGSKIGLSSISAFHHVMECKDIGLQKRLSNWGLLT